jgi:hypothetical protein
VLVAIDRKHQMTFEFLLSCWVDDQPAEIRSTEIEEAEKLPDGRLLYRDIDRDFAALLARQHVPFEEA